MFIIDFCDNTENSISGNTGSWDESQEAASLEEAIEIAKKARSAYFIISEISDGRIGNQWANFENGKGPTEVFSHREDFTLIY